MQTVVVGLDVPPTRVEAVRWAADYCRLNGDELLGVVAYSASQSELPPDWNDEHVADVRKHAEAVLDALAPGVPHRVEVGDADPRTVIPEVARDEDAVMVVVRARGGGGVHGLGLGSVDHLAHDLLTPVVIVPAAGGPLPGGHLVVGLDGSRHDVATLAWAVQLARAVHSSVTVVYASDPMAVTFGHPHGETKADQHEDAVRAQVARAATEGVEIAMKVEVDLPVTALTRVADQVDAAVIVVGRKGAGGLRGVLLGRVPAQLPYRSHRPVAIVPRHSAD